MTRTDIETARRNLAEATRYLRETSRLIRARFRRGVRSMRQSPSTYTASKSRAHTRQKKRDGA